ncbi:MAG: hypothetical protein WAL22_12460, partial [Solirubrobacteraceae bacterium]
PTAAAAIAAASGTARASTRDTERITTSWNGVSLGERRWHRPCLVARPGTLGRIRFEHTAASMNSDSDDVNATVNGLPDAYAT